MSEQSLKAAARRNAEAAPKADPDIAAQALKEARSAQRPHKSQTQPVYKTQTEEIAGRNIHRDEDAIISEFDDPAAHTYKDGRR